PPPLRGARRRRHARMSAPSRDTAADPPGIGGRPGATPAPSVTVAYRAAAVAGPLPIEEVAVRVFEAPLPDPVRMSFAALASRRACVVEIRSGGLTGIGETWVNHPAWAWRERVATLAEGVVPALLGQDASAIG